MFRFAFFRGGIVFDRISKYYKYLLTVAGCVIVTLQGRIASPPRWLITRVLFFVIKWLCTFEDRKFLCIFFSLVSEKEERKT